MYLHVLYKYTSQALYAAFVHVSINIGEKEFEHTTHNMLHRIAPQSYEYVRSLCTYVKHTFET